MIHFLFSENLPSFHFSLSKFYIFKRDGMINRINICDYIKQHNSNDILIDLRSKEMYDYGTIENAVNIPMDNISELYELPKEKRICLFCQAGDYSAEIAELLSDAGLEVCDLAGGYREYMRYRLMQNEQL